MINLQTFLLGLLIISTITSLTTEAVKKILTDCGKTYYSNVLAGVVALVISIAVGICYVLLNNLTFTTSVIIYIIALVFLSWLCAMVGYDKVIQAIGQLENTNGSGE